MGRAPGAERRFFLFPYRSLHDFVEGYANTVTAYSHGAINALLHHDLLCPEPILYLIELPLMLYGVVVFEGPFCFHAEDGLKIKPFRPAVEILLFLGWYGKSPIIPGQIRDEEPVCFFYSTDPLEPHLFYQPVLESVEEPFDPSLGQSHQMHVIQQVRDRFGLSIPSIPSGDNRFASLLPNNSGERTG